MDPDLCRACGRGKEACSYCENTEREDWMAICDCGLYDFGCHLTDCQERDAFKYVMTDSWAAAELPR